MLISIKISRNSAFFSGSGKWRRLFLLLINVKMPTIDVILIFMSRKNFMLNLTSGLGLGTTCQIIFMR